MNMTKQIETSPSQYLSNPVFHRKKKTKIIAAKYNIISTPLC